MPNMWARHMITMVSKLKMKGTKLIVPLRPSAQTHRHINTNVYQHAHSRIYKYRHACTHVHTGIGMGHAHTPKQHARTCACEQTDTHHACNDTHACMCTMPR